MLLCSGCETMKRAMMLPLGLALGSLGEGFLNLSAKALPHPFYLVTQYVSSQVAPFCFSADAGRRRKERRDAQVSEGEKYIHFSTESLVNAPRRGGSPRLARPPQNLAGHRSDNQQPLSLSLL
jgi:hypothetical protein